MSANRGSDQTEIHQAETHQTETQRAETGHDVGVISHTRGTEMVGLVGGTGPYPRYRILGTGAALVAVSAYGGSAGLISGGLSIGDRLNGRLPFHSPVFGGVALAVLVGVPFTALAKRAFSFSPKAGLDAQLAGVLLIGWLLVELAFIRELSFFHPLYALIGAGFVAAGRLIAKSPAMRAASTTVDTDAVSRFLGLKRIALIGASGDSKKFGNTVFRELVRHGYDVVPVNPRTSDIDGKKCFRSLAEIGGPVEGAMIMLTGKSALAAVHECAAVGVRHIWLFRGAGNPGAMSDETYSACREHGIDVVAGACPLMFLQPVATFHQAHLMIRRLEGSVVETA